MSGPRSERSGVLCAGSLIVDVGKSIEAYPPLDHLTTIDEVWTSTGGPGLNMAVDLRQLGAAFDVGVLGVVGTDDYGSLILSECERLDIDTTGVRRVTGVATSFTDAMVERVGGRRTFFHHPGTSALFDAADLDLAATSARILHVGSPGIHAAMDRRTPDGGNGWSDLLRRAQEAGLRTNIELVSLDAALLTDLVLPCLPYADTIVINELEAGRLTGLHAEVPSADGPADWSALEAMATGLVERGVRGLAVVHFPAGCVAAAPDGRTWRQGSVALARDQVRSTTGAGDAFAAGVLLGRHEGWSVEESLRVAVATAAACVQSQHTSRGIASAADNLAAADALGYRPTT